LTHAVERNVIEELGLSSLWYVSKQGHVRGPFPTGALVQERLLGRLGDDDLVSSDRSQWLRFALWPELAAAFEAATPAASTPEAEAWASERAKARMRWADERTGQDRRSELPESTELQAQGRRGGPERRLEGGSALPLRERRPRHIAALFGAEVPVWVLIGIVVVVAGILGLLAYVFGPVNPVPVKFR